MKRQLTKMFHSSVAEIMKIQTNSQQAQLLQSVISMVYTLVEEGKTERLNDVLNFHFPKYYSSKPKLFSSEN
jgi:hypothetical protein